MVVAKIEEFVGECQNELPYGDVFWVIRQNGDRAMTCTHIPPHDSELANGEGLVK